MTEEHPKIRPVERGDLSQVLELIALHSAYERSPYDPQGMLQKLDRDIFDREKLHCLVSEIDGSLIAYATCTIQYSTWEAAEYVYLDCLFVRESARGKGLGFRLMQEIRSWALNRSLNLVQWQTPNFNEDAIRFYERLGADSLGKERFFWKLDFD